MAKVEFLVTEFRTRYPQFKEEVAPEGWLRALFEEACGILDNSDASPVPYDPCQGEFSRKRLLYCLVCHLATLEIRARDGQAGPVASATQGSVSVSYVTPPVTGKSADWFQQTQCGAVYWQAIQGYSLGGFYVPGPRRQHPWA